MVFPDSVAGPQIKRYRTYAYAMRARAGGAAADDAAPALPARAPPP